jgi:hypothetical protein
VLSEIRILLALEDSCRCIASMLLIEGYVKDKENKRVEVVEDQ